MFDSVYHIKIIDTTQKIQQRNWQEAFLEKNNKVQEFWSGVKIEFMSKDKFALVKCSAAQQRTKGNNLYTKQEKYNTDGLLD